MYNSLYNFIIFPGSEYTLNHGRQRLTTSMTKLYSYPLLKCPVYLILKSTLLNHFLIMYLLNMFAWVCGLKICLGSYGVTYLQFPLCKLGFGPFVLPWLKPASGKGKRSVTKDVCNTCYELRLADFNLKEGLAELPMVVCCFALLHDGFLQSATKLKSKSSPDIF